MTQRSQELSPSSSDGEPEQKVSGDPLAASPGPKGNKMKFKIPADFVACSLEPMPSITLNKLCSSSTELWLIKAPVDFNPECFNNRKVPLCGFQTMKSKKDGPSSLYNVFSSARVPDSSHLLVPSGKEGQLACGPVFSGYLNICESFSDPRESSSPKAIAASSARQIPQGLKQRFKPFGAISPTGGPQMKCRLQKPTKRRKLAIKEASAETPKTKKKREKVGKKCMGRTRQLESVKQAPTEEEEAWGKTAQGFETQSPNMVITHAKKKKKRERGGADDFTRSQELDEEMRTGGTIEAANIPTLDKLENRHKKKKRKRKPVVEESFVPAAEEASCSFQKKMKHMFLKESSESTVSITDGEQDSKNLLRKSRRRLSDYFALMVEDQSSGFHKKSKGEFLEDSLGPPAEEHGCGKKKKKKQRHANEGS